MMMMMIIIIIMVIIIIIIIIIICHRTVTRWQLSFYMCTKYEIGY